TDSAAAEAGSGAGFASGSELATCVGGAFVVADALGAATFADSDGAAASAGASFSAGVATAAETDVATSAGAADASSAGLPVRSRNPFPSRATCSASPSIAVAT